MGRSRVTIGVGGALIQFNPVYMTILEDLLTVLAPPDVQVGDSDTWRAFL